MVTKKERKIGRNEEPVVINVALGTSFRPLANLNELNGPVERLIQTPSSGAIVLRFLRIPENGLPLLPPGQTAILLGCRGHFPLINARAMVISTPPSGDCLPRAVLEITDGQTEHGDQAIARLVINPPEERPGSYHVQCSGAQNPVVIPGILGSLRRLSITITELSTNV